MLRCRRRNLSILLQRPQLSSTNSHFPLFRRSQHSVAKSSLFWERLVSHDQNSHAIVHSSSKNAFTYGQLLSDVARSSGTDGSQDSGAREAIVGKNNYNFVVALLSTIAKGNIAVPVSPLIPSSELDYILSNSGAETCWTDSASRSLAEKTLNHGSTNCEVQNIAEFRPKEVSSDLREGQWSRQSLGNPNHNGGLMLYTSGTTDRPKGVLLPLDTLEAQCQSLIEAWKFSPTDRLLHCLPLHHIHGIINGLLAPLVAGLTIEFLYPFSAQKVWSRFAAPFFECHNQASGISIFTAVPTIYNKLLKGYAELDLEEQAASKRAVSKQNLRLVMSGSAALPSPQFSQWAELSGGNALLERYGMTEVGMALSCGLAIEDRVDGSVGWPLPGVEVRLVDADTGDVIPPENGVDCPGREREGEIQISGPTVFREYWQNEKATASEFVEDRQAGKRWFKTGDVAIRRHVPGSGSSDASWAKGPMYFIKGRMSVDIIKSGGEKISALEVERELLSLDIVSEAAVIGIESSQWGQIVAAVVVLNQSDHSFRLVRQKWTLMDMRRALKDRLAKHKLPQKLKVVNSMPRNAMGKVNKKTLAKEFV